MLLLINNSTQGNTLSFIFQIRKALRDLKIPYIETNKIDEKIIKNKHKIKGIILSGSPMILFDDVLSSFNFDIYYMLNINVPVLGICFGCQLLTLLNGGSLIDRKSLFCETTEVTLSENMLFKGLDNPLIKFCFNNLPVGPKKSELVKEIAWIHIDGRQKAIAFEFQKNKVFGILGHPELHKHSWVIYKNFAKFCGSI
jgi:GMP synthase (glutamine-hydrolysing)